MTETPQHGKHQHKKYALTCEEYEALWARSHGRCEICGVLWRYTPHGMLHIDHDERLGMWAVRGLLCSRCNTQLGTPGRLQGAEVEAYLSTPWRTAPPKHLVDPLETVESREMFEFFAMYGRINKQAVAARTRLQEAILRNRHAMTVEQMSTSTGMSVRSIAQLIRAEEDRLALGHLGRPAERPFVRPQRSEIG